MESRFVVGSVPYVNARPLVSFFEGQPGALPVDVVYAVPSKLPRMLEEGVHAVLASSIDALHRPGRRVAARLCIASEGPVLSVRLFSKVPPQQIRTLALDQSSLTSNALAMIILQEAYGADPITEPEPPDLGAMLQEHDACILIGDIGMRADGSDFHVLDLGEEWTKLTGLPFVWALWIGLNGLTEELAGHLLESRQKSPLGAGQRVREDQEAERDRQIAAISSSSSWTFEEVRNYLTETIVFDLGERELAGLREFARRIGAPHFPELVQPEAVSPAASR